MLPRGNRYVVAKIGAALPWWGKGRCVGAGRRCLPAARALREGARPILGFWDGGGGRNSPACKLGYCRARGERRTGCFDVWPHAQGHGSGGTTAGPARTRLRDLSLKNPIGCREAPGCYNDSRAAPAREPSGALRTLAQSETQQRTPDRYSRGRGSTLTSGSAGRRHCRPP